MGKRYKAIDLNNVKCPSDAKRVKDMKGNPLVLFTNQWSIKLLWKEMKALNLKNLAEINFVQD